MRFDIYRVLGWVIPMLCIAVAAGIIVNRHAVFVETASAHERASLALQQARLREDEIGALPAERRFAVAPKTSEEETLFLNDLRRRALGAGVTIVRWSSRLAVFGDTQQAGAATPRDLTDLPTVKGIAQVHCEIALDGDYRALRQFLAGLDASDRLFTLSNVSWTRTETNTELTMTLARYVAPDQNPSSQTNASGGTGTVGSP